MVPRKQLTMGWEDDAWTADGQPAGSWQLDSRGQLAAGQQRGKQRAVGGWTAESAGRCPVAPPPWLVMAGRSGRWYQLLYFFWLIF